jgi:hypothetical protein
MRLALLPVLGSLGLPPPKTWQGETLAVTVDDTGGYVQARTGPRCATTTNCSW